VAVQPIADRRIAVQLGGRPVVLWRHSEIPLLCATTANNEDFRIRYY